MRINKRFFLESLVLYLLITVQTQLYAQCQLLSGNKSDSSNLTSKFQAKPLAIIVPAAMIGYGVATLELPALKSVNAAMQEEVYAEHPHSKTTIDNYLQFAPTVAVYGLNAWGVKGLHNFRDRTMIYLLSNLVMNTAVYAGKTISHQLRPDGSAYTSFPSGHTAEAFLSAEFMRLEYRDKSPWFGVAGYAIAATTEYLRMYNNRHWFSDVIAGAGVGILSTDFAYWIYPTIAKRLFKSEVTKTAMLPLYQNGTVGLCLVHQF